MMQNPSLATDKEASATAGTQGFEQPDVGFAPKDEAIESENALRTSRKRRVVNYCENKSDDDDYGGISVGKKKSKKSKSQSQPQLASSREQTPKQSGFLFDESERDQKIPVDRKLKKPNLTASHPQGGYFENRSNDDENSVDKLAQQLFSPHQNSVNHELAQKQVRPFDGQSDEVESSVDMSVQKPFVSHLPLFGCESKRKNEFESITSDEDDSEAEVEISADQKPISSSSSNQQLANNHYSRKKLVDYCESQSDDDSEKEVEISVDKKVKQSKLASPPYQQLGRNEPRQKQVNYCEAKKSKRPKQSANFEQTMCKSDDDLEKEVKISVEKKLKKSKLASSPHQHLGKHEVRQKQVNYCETRSDDDSDEEVEISTDKKPKKSRQSVNANKLSSLPKQIHIDVIQLDRQSGQMKHCLVATGLDEMTNLLKTSHDNDDDDAKVTKWILVKVVSNSKEEEEEEEDENKVPEKVFHDACCCSCSKKTGGKAIPTSPTKQGAIPKIYLKGLRSDRIILESLSSRPENEEKDENFSSNLSPTTTNNITPSKKVKNFSKPIKRKKRKPWGRPKKVVELDEENDVVDDDHNHNDIDDELSDDSSCSSNINASVETSRSLNAILEDLKRKLLKQDDEKEAELNKNGNGICQTNHNPNVILNSNNAILNNNNAILNTNNALSNTTNVLLNPNNGLLNPNNVLLNTSNVLLNTNSVLLNANNPLLNSNNPIVNSMMMSMRTNGFGFTQANLLPDSPGAPFMFGESSEDGQSSTTDEPFLSLDGLVEVQIGESMDLSPMLNQNSSHSNLSSNDLEDNDEDSSDSHSRKSNGGKTRRSTETFQCDYCLPGPTIFFSRRELLLHHHQDHRGGKIYPCPDCGREFTQRSNMMSHLRVERGETQYKCPTCSKGFRHPSDLKRHLKTACGQFLQQQNLNPSDYIYRNS